MLITEHFSVREALRSALYPHLAAKRLTRKQDFNCFLLATLVLEPLRKSFGRPIQITSWVRSKRLNARLKGAKTSQHLDGSAVDFIIPGVDMMSVYQWLLALEWPGEVIFYRSRGHVHVALPRRGTKADHYIEEE